MRRYAAVIIAMSVFVACGRRESPAGDSAPRVDSVAASAQTPATIRSTAVVPVTTVFTLASPAFQNGDSIPRPYSCDGADKSPALTWLDTPPSTVSFALIVEDPDAPGGTFIHWVLYDIPSSISGLPENVAKTPELPQLGGAKQGRTGFGKIGYGGPCPPPGPAHHYHFRLFALDATLALPAGATRDQVMTALQPHKIGEAELVGLYTRAK